MWRLITNHIVILVYHSLKIYWIILDGSLQKVHWQNRMPI